MIKSNSIKLSSTKNIVRDCKKKMIKCRNVATSGTLPSYLSRPDMRTPAIKHLLALGEHEDGVG